MDNADAVPPAAVSVDPLTVAIQQVERPHALKVLALCSSPHSAYDSTRQAPSAAAYWRHVSDFEYIGPTHHSSPMWDDFSIVTYLVHTAISIPPRSDSRSDPWVVVTSNDSGPTTLPRGYRVPLLWLMKVQWESLKLLLTAARPLWDSIKFDLLYIGRLTQQFLAKARSEVRIKRQWRDPTFDRTLTRFFNGWMGCRDVFVWDFYREFRDEEYKDDVLARRWAQKVPKGIQGFALTEQELVDGCTAEQFQMGLVINREDSTFIWTPDPEVERPPSVPPIAPARRNSDEAAPGTTSRGSSPLTASEVGSDIEMIAESLNPPKASEPSTPAPTPTPSMRTAPVPLAIQTGIDLPRKKSHKAKPRPKTDRLEKASRPLRTRTMSGSVSAMSPATPMIAQLGRPDLSLPGSSTASSPNRTPSGFDFTAPVESRGRKRKIESIYSNSTSPLTSDSEDNDSPNNGPREPKNPNRVRQAQNMTPDGRAFSTNSRIVIPRLANPEAYSRPTTEAYTAPMELPPSAAKPARKASASESGSPRKAKAPIVPLQHYKLYAISSSPSTNPFDPQNPATSIPPFATWRHPQELDYIGPNHLSAAAWTDLAIVTYMVDNAFTIPSRAADNKQTWVEVQVRNRDGTTISTRLPRGYRIPLLWLGRVQWDCLKLLLTSGREYWPSLRFDILHIARLSAEFLAKARRETKIKRQYRDVMFDRALSRFFNGWMGSRDEFVWDFYREFRDEEYEDDMLQRRWLQKAVKGIQGFAITEQDLSEGIAAEQFMQGLHLDRQQGTFAWIDEDAPAVAATSTSTAPATADPSSFVATPTPTPVFEATPTPVSEATPTPAVEPAPAPAPAIEVAQPQPVEGFPAAPPSTVETVRSRMHSPLSLSQVAGVQSGSSSPLTPVFNLDTSMDVDPPVPAQPAATMLSEQTQQSPLMPETQKPTVEDGAPTPVQDLSVAPEQPAPTNVVQVEPTPVDVAQVETMPTVVAPTDPTVSEVAQVESALPTGVPQVEDAVTNGNPPASRQASPPAADHVPYVTIPAVVVDSAIQNDEAPAPTEVTPLPLRWSSPPATSPDAEGEAAPPADDTVAPFPGPELEPDMDPADADGMHDSDDMYNDFDDIDALSDDDYLGYPPSPPAAAADGPNLDTAMDTALHNIQMNDPSNILLYDLPVLNGDLERGPMPREEDEPEFDETDYIRSRLPSPFVMTPTSHPFHSRQPESPRASEPPVERVPTPPAERYDSESIRSSSSPEPRFREPEESVPVEQSAEEHVALPERLPSPPPDSDEDDPLPAKEPTADAAPEAADGTVETDAPPPVGVSHILPISHADAVDEFPPGFQFLGAQRGHSPQSNSSSMLSDRQSRDSTPEAPAQTHPPTQNTASDSPPVDDLQVRSTAEALRASAPLPVNGHAHVDDTTATPPHSPMRSPVTAETVLSAVPQAADSRRVKLEIMTVSLGNGRGGSEVIEVEGETDMDIETPIDVDMEDRPPSPLTTPLTTAVVPAVPHPPSPPLSASQSLFTPDVTPRHVTTTATSSADVSTAPPRRSPSPVHTTPSVSSQSDGYTLPPGLSTLLSRASSKAPSEEYNVYTPSRPSPNVPPTGTRRFVPKKPNHSVHNASQSNGAREYQSGGFVYGGTLPGTLFLRDKQPVARPSQAAAFNMAGGGAGGGSGVGGNYRRHSPIRIPDEEYDPRRKDEEYDPRRKDPIILGPSSSYSLPSIQATLPPSASYSVPSNQATHAPAASYSLPSNPVAHSPTSSYPLPSKPPAHAPPSSYSLPSNPPGHAQSSYSPSNPSGHAQPSSYSPSNPSGNGQSSSYSPSTPSGHPQSSTYSLPNNQSGRAQSVRGQSVRAQPGRAPSSYSPTTPSGLVQSSTRSLSVAPSAPTTAAPSYPRWTGYTPTNGGGIPIPGDSPRPYSPFVPLNLNRFAVPPPAVPPPAMNTAPYDFSGVPHFDGYPQFPTHPGDPPVYTQHLYQSLLGLKDAKEAGEAAAAAAAGLPPPLPSDGLGHDLAEFLARKPPAASLVAPVVAVDGAARADPAPEIEAPQANHTPDIEMDNMDVVSPPRGRSPSPVNNNGAPAEAHPVSEQASSSAIPSTAVADPPAATPSVVSPAPLEVNRAPEVDMVQLEATLFGRLKAQLRSQLKDELKDELQVELQVELRHKLKDEMLLQLREELPGQMKQELLGQLRDELLAKMKDDLLLQLKDELLIQMKAQLLTQLKAELLVQLKDELLLQLKDELLLQLQDELLVLLKDELKAQLTNDLTVALKDNLREQLRADLKDDMVLDLKDHFTSQLKDQLKVLLVQLKDAVNSQLRDDLIIQLKYFIAKLKDELIVQLKDTLTVHLKDGLITQVKAALTAQLRDGLGAQREQLNLDFERRRLFLEQQPRIKAIKPASPAVSTSSRPTPTTPRPLPSLLFQARHPLHHLVLSTTSELAGMDVDAATSTPGSPVVVSPSKAKGHETPLPVKSQRKQSWFATGYQAS